MCVSRFWCDSHWKCQLQHELGLGGIDVKTVVKRTVVENWLRFFFTMFSTSARWRSSFASSHMRSSHPLASWPCRSPPFRQLELPWRDLPRLPCLSVAVHVVGFVAFPVAARLRRHPLWVHPLSFVAFLAKAGCGWVPVAVLCPSSCSPPSSCWSSSPFAYDLLAAIVLFVFVAINLFVFVAIWCWSSSPPSSCSSSLVVESSTCFGVMVVCCR